jgi:hypothetical protein
VTNDPQGQNKGERAEEVAGWYFRLNGFLSIPSFIVHPDQVSRYPLGEADYIAVRFPNSNEKIGERFMDDDPIFKLQTKILFVIVEIKANQICSINGPFNDRKHGNMQRVIRRLGFACEEDLDSIAEQVYRECYWENKEFSLQYVSIGNKKNDQIAPVKPKWAQVTWDDVGEFFFERFKKFPEKLPITGNLVHHQWPNFGRKYGEAILSQSIKKQKDSVNVINNYIENGNI